MNELLLFPKCRAGGFSEQLTHAAVYAPQLAAGIEPGTGMLQPGVLA